MEQMQTPEEGEQKKRISIRKRLAHQWRQRTLLWEFLKRDLQARYVGSVMGFFWSVINPIVLLGLYTFIFGFVIRPDFTGRYVIDSGNRMEIALYIFCGLLPWYALQEAILRSTTCIVDNGHLIRQIRFPAKILPAYLVLSSLINQLIGTFVLIGAIWFIRGAFSTALAAFPLVVILQGMLAFGLALFLCTLHVYLRDTAPLVTIGVMVAMWTTPMFYTLEAIPEKIRTLVLFNPFSHMIILYHGTFLDKEGAWPDLTHWVIMATVSLLALFVGYRIFTRAHSEFVDVI